MMVFRLVTIVYLTLGVDDHAQFYILDPPIIMSPILDIDTMSLKDTISLANNEADYLINRRQ